MGPFLLIFLITCFLFTSAAVFSHFNKLNEFSELLKKKEPEKWRNIVKDGLFGVRYNNKFNLIGSLFSSKHYFDAELKPFHTASKKATQRALVMIIVSICSIIASVILIGIKELL